ncbi:MAG: glycosyltransferase family 4 protein [Anaerolineae bacterium]|nr:glycosyltransferase family 4 protein [Anaerolineae bacterium]
MRIGFVTGEYPPMEGGIGDVTHRLAAEMAAQGHTVSVFTREQAKEAGQPGIDVSPVVTGTWGWSTNSSIKAWAVEKQLNVVNVQFQTAAFNMNPSIHWLPDRLPDIPVVVTFHDLRVPYLFPKAGAMRKWIVRRFARQADGVITTNLEDESILRNEWHIRHVRRIPIGSSITPQLPSDYNRRLRRASLSIGADDLLIGYFGFLNHSKGGLTLMEALLQLIKQGVPAHVILIGGRQGVSDPTNADYAAQVDDFIRQHDLIDHVHWTGFIDNTEVSACFYDSDLVALPYVDGASLRRSTLMAALAHSRAIVTTIPQIEIPELTGAVETVLPEDASALAGAIYRLWHDKERVPALEDAAKLAAQQFAYDEIAHNTVDFFSELIR